MADFSKPATTDDYTAVLQEIRDLADSLAKLQNGTTDTNIPDGAVRWNAINKGFEKYDAANATWGSIVTIGNQTTDDLTEGVINLYDIDHFAGKTQDDLPDGTTYKQYNPANVAITGGSINGTTTPINAQTGTAYTLVLSDSGKIVTMNNASANTVTVPANATVAFSIGTQVDIIQLGAGKTTIAGASGVTINSKGGNLSINGQYVGVSLIQTATDVWLLVGDLIA